MQELAIELGAPRDRCGCPCAKPIGLVAVGFRAVGGIVVDGFGSGDAVI